MREYDKIYIPANYRASVINCIVAWNTRNKSDHALLTIHMPLNPFTTKRKNKGKKCVSRVLANGRCAEIIDENLPSVEHLVRYTNDAAEVWSNFVDKAKQLAEQMKPPKNHIEYVTEKTLEIMKERGKRKQEFIEIRKQ